MRRPIKKAFTSNSKKLVINVQKNIDKTVESAYPEYVTEQDWRENTEEILSDAVKSMFQGGLAGAISKKPGIVRTNQIELRKHELCPYHRTRDFRKKIALLYVPVLTSHTEEANGRFPVFKVAKNTFDALIKKACSGSASSNVRPNKVIKKTTSTIYQQI